MRTFHITVLIPAIPLILQGCATPNFDVPDNRHGPTAYSVVQRITCELVQMIADNPNGRNYRYRNELLDGNYDMAATLTLDVKDTGELSPSLDYTPTKFFSIGGGIDLSQTRTQEFSENLLFSMKDLRTEWQYNHHFGDCPHQDTNLAGDLGLEKTVTLAFSSPNRNTAGPQGKEFGGSVNFVVVRNINSVGPNWKLAHFNGPGGLAKLGRTNTDNLSFAFAQQPVAPPKAKKAITGASNAKRVLQEFKLNSINQQLTRIGVSPN